MKSRFLLIFALLAFTLTVNAIPAKPVKTTLFTTDGTSVEVTLCGDEHFSFYKDDAGLPYIRNAKGRLEKVTHQFVSDNWKEKTTSNLERAGIRRSRALSPRRLGESGVTTGKHHGLVILMQFTDVKFVTPDPKATFNRFFNEVGYRDNGMSGSVKDYFLSQSYGQLEIDFDIVGPFTTKYEMAYYGAPEGNSNDTNPAGMVAEGIDAASKEVNFSDYDWDNDGEVDQVFVVYAGYNQAQGADANTIWPHEWTLAAANLTRVYNKKTINTYGCSSELMGNGRYATGILDGIGTACHEFSHCLGLPDMYDTSSNGNFGMGPWDIMDQGSYNNNARTPAGYTSYEKIFSGWMEAKEINTMTRINDMKPLASSPEAYILYNDANKNEYYLLENRQPVGFDAGLYGHGLLILHVDYNQPSWKTNNVNTDPSHQRMTIFPADGILQNTNNSLAGDPWPGNSGNTALTNYTEPAAILYNDNVDGRKFMSKPIDNITENTANQTVSFVLCRPELDVPSPDNGTEKTGEVAFTVTWPAVKDAQSYELELTEIGKASDDPKDALVREYDFSACVSKTVGFSDISTKLSSYGLSGWTGSKLFTTPNKLRLGTSTTTGYVRTPTWPVPESTEMTVVIGVAPGTAGTTVKGVLQLAYGNSGEAATIENVSFETSADGKLVFNFTIRKDLFYITITPDKWMFLNYFAIYDGTWSAEQLGIENNGNAKAFAPRLANTITKHNTTTNSYTFSNLKSTSRYIYRVRALGEEGNFSNWSEEKTFVFSSAGIDMVKNSPIGDGITRVYDMQGRLVYSEPTSSFDINHVRSQGILVVKQNGAAQKYVK